MVQTLVFVLRSHQPVLSGVWFWVSHCGLEHVHPFLQATIISHLGHSNSSELAPLPHSPHSRPFSAWQPEGYVMAPHLHRSEVPSPPEKASSSPCLVISPGQHLLYEVPPSPSLSPSSSFPDPSRLVHLDLSESQLLEHSDAVIVTTAFRGLRS